MNRIVLLLLAFAANPASAAPLFDIVTVETAPSDQRAVVTGFLTGVGRASLLVIAGEKRTLDLYEAAVDGYGADPVASVRLPPDVVVIDACRLSSKDALVGFKRNEAVAIDPRSGSQRHLIAFESIYGTPMDDEVAKVDLCRDLNGDGLDDFIVPGFDGYTVFVQGPGGRFIGPLAIHAPPLMEMSYDDYPWYRPRHAYLADMTLDQRKDLVFWLDKGLAVYEQLPDGTFSAGAKRMKTPVVLDHEGTEGLSVRMGEKDQSDLQSTALYQIDDIDGDGVTDLVTLSVQSSGVFNKQTTYGFYKGGKSGPRDVRFSTTPVSRIRSGGVQFEMAIRDFDNDGAKELEISSVRIGLAKVLAALLTGSVSVDLDFYRMKDGRYPDKPNVTRKITATFDLSTGEVFFPSVLLADVDGDALTDLLVQEDSDELRVFRGRPGAALFSDRPIRIEVDMPGDPDDVETADLNRDGKTDLVLMLKSPPRVTLLISR